LREPSDGGMAAVALAKWADLNNVFLLDALIFSWSTKQICNVKVKQLELNIKYIMCIYSGSR
jgi:hypothetical protein